MAGINYDECFVCSGEAEVLCRRYDGLQVPFCERCLGPILEFGGEVDQSDDGTKFQLYFRTQERFEEAKRRMQE